MEEYNWASVLDPGSSSKQEVLLMQEAEGETMEYWKRVYYSETQAGYKASKKINTTGKQMDQVNQDAQLEELKVQLARQQAALGEKDLKIAEKDLVIADKELIIVEKDRSILVREGDKQAFLEEMQYVIDGSLTTLWDISEEILDLTVDLEKFQLKNKDGVNSSTAARERQYPEMPTTLFLAQSMFQRRSVMQDRP